MTNPFDLIDARLNRIEELVLDLKHLSKKDDVDVTRDILFNTDEASAFLHVAKPTLYSKVCRGELPHMKKGKRLYFSKEALLEYIHSGRVKTNEELQESALDYLNIKSK
jgi:excisionase family DNA binding protein